MGYRYYETRYEDYVLGQGSAGEYDYRADVALALISFLSKPHSSTAAFSIPFSRS